MKKFYQCDITEGANADGSIWTSEVIYADSVEEAEFHVMLGLQQDWGDSYMPDPFIDAFGAEGSKSDPVFPGIEAWRAGDYWVELESYVVTGMLTVDTVTALAKLGKIKCDLPSDAVDAALADQAQLHVVVDMSEVGAGQPVAEAPPPKFAPGDRVHISKVNRTKTVVSRGQPYGHEFRYVLKGDDGSLDYGWREDELELVESDEELQDKADQKHNAQMLDGCETEDELNAELRAQTQG